MKCGLRLSGSWSELVPRPAHMPPSVVLLLALPRSPRTGVGAADGAVRPGIPEHVVVERPKSASPHAHGRTRSVTRDASDRRVKP